jgi:hypothetical protein
VKTTKKRKKKRLPRGPIAPRTAGITIEGCERAKLLGDGKEDKERTFV